MFEQWVEQYNSEIPLEVEYPTDENISLDLEEQLVHDQQYTSSSTDVNDFQYDSGNRLRTFRSPWF